MKHSLSIGAKLTVWYGLCMAGALGVLCILAFFGMRNSIHATVDEELHDRMKAVYQTAVLTLQKGNIETLRRELDEDSELRPQIDLLQVWDDRGNIVYQSVPPKGVRLPPSITSHTGTFWIEGKPIRVLQDSLMVNQQRYHVQVAEQMEEFYEALHRFQKRLLILAPLALLMASALGYWMSRRALAPVDQMTQAAHEISAHNLSSRLSIPNTGDELQRLAETLNQMLARIEASLERISRFSADASHELRTPITVMRTRTELALRRSRTSAENQHTLEQLHRELMHTSDLLDNLMFLARTDSDAEHLRMVPTNIKDVLQDVLAQALPMADAKHVTLDAELPQQPIWIAGDHQLLQRLFLILVDNAVKYTPSSGQVSIRFGAENGMIVISVIDSGIGISNEDLPHIFDRFYRADKARSREMGGAGLGLSIGRWIAEAHGGSVVAESQPATGSTFKVALPRHA